MSLLNEIVCNNNLYVYGLHVHSELDAVKPLNNGHFGTS